GDELILPTDPDTDRDLRARDRRHKFKEAYATQLKDVIPIVQPVDWKGQGVVQIASGKTSQSDWETFLELNPHFAKDTRDPAKEDIWLAQEDLWVKRELLRVIRMANDSVGQFKDVTAGEQSASASDPFGEPVISNSINEQETKKDSEPVKEGEAKKE